MNKNLTRDSISKHLSADLPNNSESRARKFVDLLIDEIIDLILAGNSLQITGFGHLEVINKKSRPGLNPKTKQKYLVLARKILKFTPGRKLKEILQFIKDRDT